MYTYGMCIHALAAAASVGRCPATHMDRALVLWLVLAQAAACACRDLAREIRDRGDAAECSARMSLYVCTTVYRGPR